MNRINQLPFMQIIKDGRAYILLLPFNAPFDEAQEVLKEFIVQVDEEKAFRADLIEKAKLEQEMKNQNAESTAG